MAARIVSPVLTRVARTRNQELFLLVALAIGLGTAALTQAVGLSLALGAFLAGLLISTSDFAHETLARLLPLRDTFGAFFFVTVGALIDPFRVFDNVPLLVAMVGLVVVGKLLVRAGVVRLFGETLWTALLTGSGWPRSASSRSCSCRPRGGGAHRPRRLPGHPGRLAAARPAQRRPRAGAPLLGVPPRWSAARCRRRAAPREHPAGHVILCGYGRVGSAVAEALDTFHVRWVAIENDPDIVRGLRERGIPSLFGNAAQRGLLERPAPPMLRWSWWRCPRPRARGWRCASSAR